MRPVRAVFRKGLGLDLYVQVARIGARRPAAQVCLLDQEDADAVACEVTGRRATGDSSSDHDHIGHEFDSRAGLRQTLFCALC